MKTHRKKTLHIIVEQTMLEPLLDLIDRAGATGYSVLPVIAGRGHGGPWRSGEVSGASSMAMVIVIAEEALAGRLLEEAQRLLRNHLAVYYLSDVDVVRAEHF